jgi:hypothetical protein
MGQLDEAKTLDLRSGLTPVVLNQAPQSFLLQGSPQIIINPQWSLI